ncbi:MAG: GNAT family N-acetyltransferase, partial [Flavobacteriaceae bacterium]|nr:GNAT family N-acetyltransferase [Flavobacteriaceae bacterium]
YQGQAIGSKLLTEIINNIKSENAELLWFNARIKALNFYQKLGFQTIGEEFDIPYVGGHYVMFKKLI